MIRRYLSGFYNNRNSIKMELIWDVESKNILLKIIKVKKIIKELEIVRKLK